MKIIIKYDSIWKNSFLDGSNDCALPKEGRKYIASGKLLNEASFTERKISHNTVMGILSRLIGDQRKLYQARESDNYYFKTLEDKITFEDSPNYSQEIVYLRNVSGNTDQNSFAGEVSIPEAVFKSDIGKQLWAVLWLNTDELCDFICNDMLKLSSKKEFAPLIVLEQIQEIKAIKKNVYQRADRYLEAAQKAAEIFPKEYSKASKENSDTRVAIPIDKTTLENLYCSALYIQLERLSKKYDTSELVTKKGGIGGFSKRNCTIKDFIGKYTNKKKPVYGNPFLCKTITKGVGKKTLTLKKASGKLIIFIETEREQERELKELIENAGVSAFSLGKKGLAYVDKIN